MNKNGAKLLAKPPPCLVKLLLSTPGTKRAWKMAHLEGILNGLAAFVIAGNFPVLLLPLSGFKALVFHLSLAAYGNTLASIVGAWNNVRG